MQKLTLRKTSTPLGMEKFIILRLTQQKLESESIRFQSAENKIAVADLEMVVGSIHHHHLGPNYFIF